MTIKSRLSLFFKKWWSAHEASNNFFSGLSSLITIVSIIGAAIWALWSFNVLHQVDRAKAELVELQDRIRNTDSTSISIETQQIKSVSGSHAVIIEVSLSNNGQRALTFDLSPETLTVYQVKVAGDKVGAEIVYHPEMFTKIALMGGKEKNKTLGNLVLLSGAKKVLSYIVDVKQPGMYYITFIADDNGSVAFTKDEKVDRRWTSTKYIEVK